jgi:hypothetical protein
MSTTFQLGIDSSDAVTLIPEFDYMQPKRQIRNEQRTRGGKLKLYKWGDFRKFNFSLEWVTASDAAVVNSWFDSNTELLFFINSGSATEVHSVMILNKETPLAAFNRPYNNLYKGKIQLETY